MTQEEIIEGNKLIELFYSGRTLSTDGTFFGRKQGMPKQYENWYDIVSVGDLKYHSSWDWLMPVVEKIETLGYHTKISCDEFGSWTQIHYRLSLANTTETKAVNQHGTKIENTWKSVIQFITWHNTQNP